MREDTRKKIELIVWHAMSSAAMINMTLEDYRAKPSSVERNFNLIYLSNAVDDVMTYVEEWP